MSFGLTEIIGQELPVTVKDTLSFHTTSQLRSLDLLLTIQICQRPDRTTNSGLDRRPVAAGPAYPRNLEQTASCEAITCVEQFKRLTSREEDLGPNPSTAMKCFLGQISKFSEPLLSVTDLAIVLSTPRCLQLRSSTAIPRSIHKSRPGQAVWCSRSSTSSPKSGIACCETFQPVHAVGVLCEE
jgi:hypothetical protein